MFSIYKLYCCVIQYMLIVAWSDFIVCICIQMTQLLLEKGATINTFDKKDRRAVHWAAYMGHVDIVRLLVSFGAELGCRDKQVWLHHASPNCV